MMEVGEELGDEGTGGKSQDGYWVRREEIWKGVIDARDKKNYE